MDSRANPALAVLRSPVIASRAELQRVLGSNAAAVRRLLRDTGPHVVRIGRGRATRYAAGARILALPPCQPLFWDDHEPWGVLTLLAGNRVHVRAPGIDLVTEGDLPWFLENFRLRGHLARAWAGRLGYQQPPADWPLAQVLYARCRGPVDPPGALSLGTARRAPAVLVPRDTARRLARYESLADDLSPTLAAGTSAGGEQPKFAVREDIADDRGGQAGLIVKFSPPRDTRDGRRWHDLLLAEATAQALLARHGLPAASTRLVAGRHRTFLESVRFDRTAAKRKLHVVPLAAAHRAFVRTRPRHWHDTCLALVRQRRLPAADARTVRILHEFGRLIGNTDMHFGNLSLFAPDPAAGRFTLAPVYDMLPMIFQPWSQPDDEDDYFPLAPTRPAPGYEREWHAAAKAALEFWRTLAGDARASAGFRAIAEQTAAALRRRMA